MNQYGKLSLCLGRTIPLTNTLGSVFKCKYVLIEYKEVIFYFYFFPPAQSPKKCHKVLLNLLAFFLN